jgi:ABC-2 type transport system permease protein
MAHADRPIIGLTARQVRTGAIVMALASAGLVWAGMGAYKVAGSTLTGPGFTQLADNPALRALYGIPYSLDTAAAFTVWREGGFIAIVVAIWAVLASTRVLRGAEDEGWWDLVLAEPVARNRALLLSLGVLSGAAALIGLAVFVAFVSLGAPAGGAALYGLGMGLLVLTFVGVGALTSQLLAPRRRAAGVAGAVVGATYVLRMAADASNARGWLRGLTPFGWLEELRAFAGDRWIGLWPMIVVPAVLLVLTPWLASRRDVGAGLVRTVDRGATRPALLRSAQGFAWRNRLGGVIAWGAGLAALAFVLGFITDAFAQFAATNASYASTVGDMGLGSLLTATGFVGFLYVFLSVAFALYAVTGMHGEWSDEQAHRLDLPYAAGVTRTRWLGSAVVAISAGVLVIVFAVAAGMWVGASASGSDLTIRQSVVGGLNTLPVVALALGVVVLLYGTLPRYATATASTLVVGAYVLAVIGPGLRWPNWVLDLSPFHHMAYAPAAPVEWTAAIVMLVLGAAAIALGLYAYDRRDLA